MTGYEFDTQLIMRLILGMVFIFALLTFGVWILKKSGFSAQIQKSRSKNKRASIVEVQQVDTKRRLIMVRRDDVEHLILLGPNNDVLVEASIPDPEVVFQKVLKEAEQDSDSPLQSTKPLKAKG